jgi:hypothetical protein
MSEEINCVCGATNGEHSSEFMYAHTTKSQCATFRPELLWPDGPGYWALNLNTWGEEWEPVVACRRLDGEIVIFRLATPGHYRRTEMPPNNRFTRLLQQNPFGSKQ